MRIVDERDVALRRMRDIAIARDVGQGGGLPKEVVPIRKFLVDDRQQGMTLHNQRFRIQGRAEYIDSTGSGRTCGKGACCD